MDRYWAPPDFYPSNGEYIGHGEPDSPRPDAAILRGMGAASTGGFSLTSALTATRGAGGETGTWRLGGRQGQKQKQPLLHRVPRQDDGVFVRLAEDDLVRRERNLAALTMVGWGVDWGDDSNMWIFIDI